MRISMTCGVIETKLLMMRKTAERMEEIHLALLREIGNLRGSVDYLDLLWDGEANSQFMIAMESDLTEMHMLLSTIWKAKLLLERAENRYQEAERAVKYLVGRADLYQF